MRFSEVFLGLCCLSVAHQICAQWQIQDAHTTASLRGIHYVGNGVAWASGTDGTVLRTEDMGFVWQLCTIPPGAEKLDFRGIQAFDNNTAIVMSSGKGDLSRLYKTTDGCQTWKLLFTNPDKDGFWDALGFDLSRSGAKRTGVLVGDPVGGKRIVFISSDDGETWKAWTANATVPGTHCKEQQSDSPNGEAMFAASNSALFEFFGSNFALVTGGTPGAKLIYRSGGDADGMLPCRLRLSSVALPLAIGEAAGAFAIAAKTTLSYFPLEMMIVGGDYTKPESSQGNTIFVSTKRGKPLPGQSLFKFDEPAVSPRGYRSAVAYYAPAETWITVGPNGTDISTDDGRNWHPLKPGPGDAPDADQHWNALSLPFVVGPKGRIGLLHDLKPAPPASK